MSPRVHALLGTILREAEALRDATTSTPDDVVRTAARIVEAATAAQRALAAERPPTPAPPTTTTTATRTAAEHLAIGRRALVEGRHDEAEVALRESVRMAPHVVEALVLLARTLLANPKYERRGTLPVVRTLLDRAVQIAPEDAEAVALRTSIVVEMG